MAYPWWGNQFTGAAFLTPGCAILPYLDSMPRLPPGADKTRPNLTRRRESDRHQETWQIYYDDVHIGTIGERAGVPHDVDQWKWMVGFYPVSHRVD
jgi:hypothetical protein